MNTLAIILARAGSKGLPGKNALHVGGRPMAAWTIDHALGSRRITDVTISTDMPAVLSLGQRYNLWTCTRPAELAGDGVAVDAAARHAARWWADRRGREAEAVAILYANVPVRPADLTDRAVEMLERTGADSVQSVCGVGKGHPYWMRTLGDDGELEPYQANDVHRRQDLPPVFGLDGGALVVRWASLFTIDPSHPHAFLGADRRGIETRPGEVIDVDTPADLKVAEAALAERAAGVDAA